jgi:hypothetical protein
MRRGKRVKWTLQEKLCFNHFDYRKVKRNSEREKLDPSASARLCVAASKRGCKRVRIHAT